MTTYTITIDENVITMYDVLNDAWRERLNEWGREHDLVEEAREAGERNILAELRRDKFDRQMKEIHRIIFQIAEQEGTK